MITAAGSTHISETDLYGSNARLLYDPITFIADLVTTVYITKSRKILAC